MMRMLSVTLLILGIGNLSCRQAKYEFTKKPQEQKPPENLQPTPSPTPTPQVGPNEFIGENGFRMKGTPATVRVGDGVSFEGTCGNGAKEELTWQFGDGKSGVGNKATHKFDQARKYVIDASCKDDSGKIRKGSIIIIVEPAINNPGQNPGQAPGQNPGQRI
jgi:hypothetical protein